MHNWVIKKAQVQVIGKHSTKALESRDGTGATSQCCCIAIQTRDKANAWGLENGAHV